MGKRSRHKKTFGKKNKIQTKTKIQQILIATITSTLKEEKTVIPTAYKQLELRQKRIGNEQLLMGRFATNWANEYDRETKTSLGQAWICKVIQIIWEHQKQRWQERNDIAEQEINDNNKKCEATDAKIKQMYAQLACLEITDRQMMVIPEQTRIKTSTLSKLQWIRLTKEIIAKGIKRSKYMTLKEHISIRKHFNNQKSEGTSNHRKKEKRGEKHISVDKKTQKIRKENYDPP
jgi:hypothetical protein